MPTVIVEDGTGKADANSYISRAAADSYFDTQLRTTPWTGASNDDKDRALIMATAQVDSFVRWYGRRKTKAQALAWPRVNVVDYDGYEVPSDEVPVEVQEAAAEMAKALLEGDRLADSDTVGVKRVKVDVIEIEADKYSGLAPLPKIVASKLVGFGSVSGGMVGVIVRA